MSKEKKQKELWKRIENLPADWESFVSEALKNLTIIWEDYSSNFKEKKTLQDFNDRLSREWSIETGFIEGLYTLDRGTTQLLIEKGIRANLIGHGDSDKSPEELTAILSVQQNALEGLFDFIANRRPLSNSYIKSLHQEITQHQKTVIGVDSLGHYVETEMIHGDWKKLPNNPMREEAFIHEYCPPEHVDSEMDQLIQWHLEHVAAGVPPEVEAAWLHHRFTQIHPFQDGNGRVARLLASLVFLREKQFPLIVTRDMRSEYVDALEQADQDDLAPLIALFVHIQSKTLQRALSLSDNLLRETSSIDDVISSAVKKLKEQTDAVENQKNQTEETKTKVTQLIALESILRSVTKFELNKVEKKLSKELKSIGSSYSVHIDSQSDHSLDSFDYQQVSTVIDNIVPEEFKRIPVFSGWERLKITNDHTSPETSKTYSLIISLRSAGKIFSGALNVVAAFDMQYSNVSVEQQPITLHREPFTFSYLDSTEKTEERFKPWLDEVLFLGLAEWRKRL